MNDEQLRSLLRDAHADAPGIPFARTLAGARARAPERRASRATSALAAAALLIAIVAVVAIRTPGPTKIASPLQGWHAPTDFLLASRPARSSTDFLLRSPHKGAPE